MSRNLIISLNEYYHLYDRGCDKRAIFMDREDYWRFLTLLYLCNDRTKKINMRDYKGLTFAEIISLERGDPLVSIGSYVLIHNHIHQNIKEIYEGGISLFAQKVLTGYTMYFNRKYNRTGSLFSSTFKIRHVANDNYLKYLHSYIHLNPIKIIQPNWKEKGIENFKKAQKFLNEYEYSSYQDYAFPSIKRAQRNILNMEDFPEYFEENGSFERNIKDWLSYKG